MNELPETDPCKEFWDRHGANIVTRYKGTCGERLFRRPKKAIFARDYGFFAAVLSYMDKDMLI